MGLAYEKIDKTIEAERDFAKAKELEYEEPWITKELEYNDDGGQSLDLPESGPATPIFLDDFTKTIEVAPLVLEGELSRDHTYQSWSFEGTKGQIPQFEPRPKSGNHIDFGH